MIQDLLFLIGGFVAAATMIPSILNKNVRLPLLTTAPLYFVMILFCSLFLSMNLFLSAIPLFLQAIGWGYLGLYRRLN